MEETRRLARTDGLTGLVNRRTAGERLEHEVRVAARAPGPLCVALCDVDHFKKVNDGMYPIWGRRGARSCGPILPPRGAGGRPVGASRRPGPPPLRGTWGSCLGRPRGGGLCAGRRH
ncbi:MAG: GGDEF domain-containing protein [Myxococcota bacterium]